MDRMAMLFFAGIGAGCIFAGYKLFCDLPAMNGERPRSGRWEVFLMNIVPGALLALLGTGLLTAEAHSIMSHRTAIQRHEPSAEGASWRLGRHGFLPRAA